MILLVLAGAERGDDQRLGLAAGEQRRAVGARQDADFGDDRADRLRGRGRRCGVPVSRMFQRTTLAWSSLNAVADLLRRELRLALGRAERCHRPWP